MTAAGAYLLGALLLLAGLAVGAFLLNVPPAWIVGGAAATTALGAGVAARVTTTRRKSPVDGPRTR